MKKLLKFELLIFAIVMTFGFVFAETLSYEDQVAERLKPSGNVCVQGEACETATVAAVASNTGPRSGDEVYTAACAACHTTGVLAAPMLGNVEQWAPRIAQGSELLYSHAINGINAMPAKGGNASLSDDEVIAAVDHMVASVQ